MPLYQPGARNLIDWTPNSSNGVGVNGGIPARLTISATILSTGDETDRSAVIMAAMAACPAGQTVKLGPGYFFAPGMHFGVESAGKTLRGTAGQTVVRITSWTVGTGFFFSEGVAYVTAGNTKGSTTVSLPTAAQYEAGRIIKFGRENDLTLPVMSVFGFEEVMTQYAVVTSVNASAGTVSFAPPLYMDPTPHKGGAPLALKASRSNASYTGLEISFIGMEDMILDAGGYLPKTLFQVNNSHDCWFKNIWFRGTKNYNLQFTFCTRIEIRDCFFDASADPAWISTSHAGMVFSDVSAFLIENNLFRKNFPNLENQLCMSGSVIAHNFFWDAGGYGVIVASHSPGNHCNLWEGNVAPNIVIDGYFGSAAYDTFYQNWFHGMQPSLDGQDARHSLSIARFTRFYEIVGNLIGHPDKPVFGSSDNGISMGNASTYGGSNAGTANSELGDYQDDLTLTGTVYSRVDDTQCVLQVNKPGSLPQILLDPEKGIRIVWAAQTVGGTPVAAGDRWGLHVLAWDAANLRVTVGNNGMNDQPGSIPPVGTVISKMWTGQSGYAEQDDAVAYTTKLLGNTYVYGPRAGELDATGYTFPASLFRASRPAHFTGEFAWPPIPAKAATPNYSYDCIPAGKRFLTGIAAEIVNKQVRVSYSGNRISFPMTKAVSIGAGGGDGFAFASTPAGGPVTLTYNAAESSPTLLVVNTSRTIFDTEILPPITYRRPGNEGLDGILDADGNAMFSTFNIEVVNLSSATQNGVWEYTIPLDTPTTWVPNQSYFGYATKFTRAVSGVVNKVRIEYGPTTISSAVGSPPHTIQVGIFSADGTITHTAGYGQITGYNSGLLDVTGDRFATISVPEVDLPAGDYIFAFFFNTNGGDFQLRRAPAAANTTFSVLPSWGGSPYWPNNPNGNGIEVENRFYSPYTYVFGIRTIDSGTTCIAPTITPATGTYSGAQTVSLSTSTSGAQIRYTLDGSTPSDTVGTLYGGTGFTVSATTTVKAIAFKSGLANSSVTTSVITIQAATVATPTFSPTAGSFGSPQNVSISTTTPGALIYYTVDGSTPTTSSTLYGAPILVTGAVTIKAIAVKTGMNQSAQATATYSVAASSVATPELSPGAGTFPGPVSITISSVTPGAAIYYTTNGTTPTTASLVYSGPILLQTSRTIKAIGVKAGFTTSAVATGTFNITSVPPMRSARAPLYALPAT